MRRSEIEPRHSGGKCPTVVLALAWVAGVCSGADHHSADGVMVVTSSAVEAYTTALGGFHRVMSKTPVKVLDMAKDSTGAELAGALAGRPRVVVAFGTDAITALAGQRMTAPVISTMTLRLEAKRGPVLGSVCLDVPLSGMLQVLKQVFPGSTRLGILRNPARSELTAAQLQAWARASGFSARVVDCSGPEHLLRDFHSFGESVDFVWCKPDSSLYNATTVKPLILASLESRLPIIGFSESFARAGAALGIYPDFADIGCQTAEMVQKYLAGQSVPALENPRKLKVALNQRVLRIMGRRYSPPEVAEEDFLILK